MSENTDDTDGADAPKKSKKGLLIGLIGAVVLGGAGFYATYSGLLLGGETDSEASAEHEVADTHAPTSEVVFVALDPLTISLGKYSSSRHLRFRAHLEVEPDAADEVEHLTPRIIDVLNTFLRAVSESELEDPASMVRLRAQMLRRVQVVVGEGKVRDLLIMEFVLN